jgi:hypothetical protein
MDGLFSMACGTDPESAFSGEALPDFRKPLRRAQEMTSIRPPLSTPLDTAVEEPRI